MLNAMKTKSFKIIAALLAVVLTVSCVLWNTTKVHALEITDANTSGYSVFGGGTIADGKLTNATIGVFITDGSNGRYNAVNEKWMHNGTSWSSDSKVLYEGTGSEQKISAYYPYVENYISDGVKYALTATQTADTMKDDDLLYASATPLSSAATTLNFNHIMTKLVVNVTALGSEATGGKIEKVEIRGLATAATFYPENGTLTAGTDLTGSTVAYNSGNNTYEALVFPTACNTITVTVTMDDGRVFTTTVSLAGANNVLTGGTQYNISIQVGQDLVNIGDITAEKWDQVSGGNLATE